MLNTEVFIPNEALVVHLRTIQGITFTRREVDILACILAGRGAKKIASLLSISPKTAEMHIHNIMLKVGCNSREHIIDFIEGSDKNQAFKAYYSSLTLHLTFDKILKNIKKEISEATECIFIYDGDLSDSSFEWLIKNLQFIGVKISIQKNSQNSPSIMKIPILTSGNQIIIDGKSYAYYFAFLEVLKKLYPNNDFHSYWIDFNKTLEKNENEFSQRKTELKNKYHIASKFVKEFRHRSQTSSIRFLIIILLGIVLVGMYHYHLSEKKVLLHIRNNIITLEKDYYKPHFISAMQHAAFYQLRSNVLNIPQSNKIKLETIELKPRLGEDIVRIEKEKQYSYTLISPFNKNLKTHIDDILKEQEYLVTIASLFNDAVISLQNEDFPAVIEKINENLINKIEFKIRTLKILKHHRGNLQSLENIEREILTLKKWMSIAVNIKSVAETRLTYNSALNEEEFKKRMEKIIKTLSLSLEAFDKDNFNTHIILHYLFVKLLENEKDKLEKAKLKKEAERHLQLSVEKAPNEPAVLNARGLHYMYYTKEYNKALLQFNAALDDKKGQPNNVGYLHNRANLYLKLAEKDSNKENYKEAYYDAKKANNLKPNDCDIINKFVLSTIHAKGCEEGKQIFYNLYKPLCDDSAKWADSSAKRDKKIDEVIKVIHYNCGM